MQPGSVTLPTRVKEQQYERDDQWREAVPLVEGEGRLVVKKLASGAYGVRKVIEFCKQKGRVSRNMTCLLRAMTLLRIIKNV